MRSPIPSFLAAATLLLLAIPSRAEPPRDDAEAAAAPAKARKRGFVGASGGYGVASVSHPDLATPHLSGVTLALVFGWAPSDRWSAALELTSFERYVSRQRIHDRLGVAGGSLHTLAACDTCRPPPDGAVTMSTMFLLNSLGPRVDFTPMGKDGLVLGANAGLGFVSLLDTKVGAAAAAHVGVRKTLADAIVFGAEAGAQRQQQSGASATLGYASVSAQLLL